MAGIMKTPITVLQEMMMKVGVTPEYECVSQLPAADYELVGDTGPPHLRHFTVRAKLGQHARLATATTKKAARQLAAEDLYHYLRENLKRTRDFVEEEALVRHHEKVMERYRETRAEQLARPCLAQRLADYHLGLHETFDAEARALAREALASTAGRGGEVELGCAAGALGMEVEWASLPRERARPLQVVSLSPSAPPLAFAGESRDQAAAAAAAYLRRALPDPPAAAATARALTVDDLLS